MRVTVMFPDRKIAYRMNARPFDAFGSFPDWEIVFEVVSILLSPPFSEPYADVRYEAGPNPDDTWTERLTPAGIDRDGRVVGVTVRNAPVDAGCS